MALLLISRFWKWGCERENILKTWANAVALMKSWKIIGRKLVISNSNKMQPLLRASKPLETTPADSFKKRELSKKH